MLWHWRFGQLGFGWERVFWEFREPGCVAKEDGCPDRPSNPDRDPSQDWSEGMGFNQIRLKLKGALGRLERERNEGRGGFSFELFWPQAPVCGKYPG